MKGLVEKIGIDKLAHLGVGGLLCACITLVMILQDAEMIRTGSLWRAAVSPLAGTIAVMMFEFFKEYVIDKEFDWKDFWFTLAGCALVSAATGIGVLFYMLSN